MCCRKIFQERLFTIIHPVRFYNFCVVGKENCKECLKEKVDCLKDQLASQTEKVNCLKTQLDNLTEEYRRLIEKFNINKEKLKKSQAENGTKKKDLELYKKHNTQAITATELGIKQIKLYNYHANELEKRNAKDKQKASASKKG